MAISFKGAHFPQDSILMGVRWYVAYPLSTRHVEELMLERGVHVDHSTINRWVIKYSPQLSARTKIFLYVKVLSTFTDLQPSLFTTLINKKDMLTGAIYSKFTPRNSQLAP